MLDKLSHVRPQMVEIPDENEVFLQSARHPPQMTAAPRQKHVGEDKD
jgi:hypothetical protein